MPAFALPHTQDTTSPATKSTSRAVLRQCMCGMLAGPPPSVSIMHNHARALPRTRKQVGKLSTDRSQQTLDRQVRRTHTEPASFTRNHRCCLCGHCSPRRSFCTLSTSAPRTTASPTARSMSFLARLQPPKCAPIALHRFVAALARKCAPSLRHDREPRETPSPLRRDQGRNATTSKEVTARRDQTPTPRPTRTPLPSPSNKDEHHRRRHSGKRHKSAGTRTLSPAQTTGLSPTSQHPHCAATRRKGLHLVDPTPHLPAVALSHRLVITIRPCTPTKVQPPTQLVHPTIHPAHSAVHQLVCSILVCHPPVSRKVAQPSCIYSPSVRPSIQPPVQPPVIHAFQPSAQPHS